MLGIHHIVIENKRLRYEFDIRRNLTVIRGNSGTGKTTMISMLRSYELDGEGSGITVICDSPCAVLNYTHWKASLSEIHDSIVFIDDNPFERNAVRSQIADLTVPELPTEPEKNLDFLRKANLFETVSVSGEDAKRTQQYREEAQRTESAATFASYDEYLQRLQSLTGNAILLITHNTREDDGVILIESRVIQRLNSMSHTIAGSADSLIKHCLDRTLANLIVLHNNRM